MNWYRSGNWNHATFQRAINWTVWGVVSLVLIALVGMKAVLYLATFGFAALCGYWAGQSDGHAQGLLDARCEQERDEHEGQLPL